MTELIDHICFLYLVSWLTYIICFLSKRKYERKFYDNICEVIKKGIVQINVSGNIVKKTEVYEEIVEEKERQEREKV